MSDFDPFKLITGQTLEEFTKLPSFEEIEKQHIAQLSSNYPLRLLGRGEKDVFITEEERSANFHILGAPGEGKSKFLEYNIRKDIDAGLGLCLLDPSEKGDTAQNVLKYCASIGHEKVILIDPSLDRFPKLAPLNPKAVKRSVAGVVEALGILFDMKSTATPRIKRYLTALLRLLTSQGLTLAETRYFSDYYRHKREREAILGYDPDSATISNLFKSEYKFDTFFSSSVNQLDALWQEPLISILGNKEGINFIEAVSKGWVILVNLSPYRLTEDESRLLGVLVISQIIQAVDVLVNRNWKGVYYLYIDEAGRFATPQIDTLLSYKRKSGLRLVLAHHFNEQFEDRKVFNSIVNNARIKLMFDTPNPDNRLFAMKAMGFGGDITPSMAAFAYQNLPKQYAILKKNKETPLRIRIPDLPEVNISDQALKEFTDRILTSPWYGNSKPPQKNPVSPRPGEAHDVPATRTAPLSGRTDKDDVRESSEKPKQAPKRKPFKI
jgi:hypothetical protein